MERRISYYSRKVAEYTNLKNIGKNRFRYEHLMNYKQVVNKRLKEVN